MIKNTLGDLNNHLFAQMERLSDESLKGDALKEEMERSEAITKVAKQIIDGGNLVLRANQAHENSFSAESKIPKMLEG